MSYQTTYHRDATVTVWDCHAQRWLRTGEPSDDILASLDRDERDRVRLHCAGIRLSATFRRIGEDRCYSGGCPDQACAGGVAWTEARRRNGRIQTRTIWSNCGHWCASPAQNADADEILGAAC